MKLWDTPLMFQLRRYAKTTPRTRFCHRGLRPKPDTRKITNAAWASAAATDQVSAPEWAKTPRVRRLSFRSRTATGPTQAPAIATQVTPKATRPAPSICERVSRSPKSHALAIGTPAYAVASNGYAIASGARCSTATQATSSLAPTHKPAQKTGRPKERGPDCAAWAAATL